MPQQSIQYALGRIGVLRRSAVTRAQLERLMAARGYDEAARVLNDIGYTLSEAEDYQSAADRHVQSACELLRAITPMPETTDCFLRRYDAHNLKVLVKSRFLAQAPEYLSKCGTLPVEVLKHAVIEHVYKALPPALRDTMETLEKKLSVQFDPMLIDTELDRATYRMIFQDLKKCSVPVCRRYFTAKVDLQNVVMLLRVKAIGKSLPFFKQLFLEGGAIPLDKLSQGFGAPEKLLKPLEKYGFGVLSAYQLALDNAKQLPRLEKAADDYLYALFAPYRYTADNIEPVIAYLLQKQREATDIRLIMAGKLNGFTQDAVLERVRELHG